MVVYREPQSPERIRPGSVAVGVSAIRTRLRSPKPPNPTVNPRKLEHRFRMIHAGIPFTLL